MKSAILLLCCVSLVSVQAQSARMTFEGDNGREPMPVESAKLEVFLVGGIAETTLTLTFRNPTKRMQEGEFVMPLPEGATVSGYALEVDGALREALAVEKERARNAYELIKRQMVDPGLVEREAGNVYRTRVFPILPEKTKQLRIGYVETLALENGVAEYRMPLGFHGKVKNFEVEVTRAGEGTLSVDLPDGVNFQRESENEISGLGVDSEIKGDLLVRLEDEQPGIRRFKGTVDGKTYGWITGTVPDNVPRATRKKPRTVDLFWDASDSARSMDLEEILPLLDAYFTGLMNVTVNLKIVRNVVTDGGRFEIKGGDASALISKLKGIYFDGSTQFGLCQIQSELGIIVSDQVPQTLNFRHRSDYLVLHSGGPGKLQRKLDRFIDLQKGEMADWLQSMLFHEIEIRRNKRQFEDVVEFSEKRKPFFLYFDGEDSDAVEVKFKSGGKEIIESGKDGAAVGVLARRLWAQKRLLQMEGNGTSGKEITEFAIEHSLVSDYTSLIVLERFEDHIRYRIPPPEPDLRLAYEKKIKEESRPEDPDSPWALPQLKRNWDDLMVWYQKKYPWLDAALYPPMERIGIWLRATEKVFDEGERDEGNYGRARKWYEAALAVVAGKDHFENNDAYVKWSKNVASVLDQSNDLWRDDPLPKKGNLAVSVRGWVRAPGKIQKAIPLTLKDAIRAAGGVRAPGTGARVSLFRQGNRVTYNLLSDAYEPVALRPGDMVVVREEMNGWSSVDDPFFGGEPEPLDRSKEPAIVEEDWAVGGDVPAGGFGRGVPFSGDPTKMEAGAVVLADVVGDSHADLKTFRNDLASGMEPEKAYLQFKGTQARSDAFYIDVALALKKHPLLQIQVLSNLVEGKTSEAAHRRYAMWLAECSPVAMAISVLEKLQSAAAHLDRARLLVRMAMAHEHIKLTGEDGGLTLLESVAMNQEANLAAEALVERNALLGQFPEANLRENRIQLDWKMRKVLACDIRIVVSSDRPVFVRVEEPGGLTLGGSGRATVSQCGGRLNQAEPGHWSYMMRRALPGTYYVEATSKGGDATVQVGFFSNFGRPNQKVVWSTVLVTRKGQDVGSFEMTFGDE